MHIGLVYNLRPDHLDRTDPKLEEYIDGDEWKTIESIGKAIVSNGHRVSYFPSHPNLYHDLEKNKTNLDLVFNYCEWIVKGSDREAQLPMFCEILGIPHTGPGPLSAALILNKSRAKEIWSANGVKTALSQIFYTPQDKLSRSLKFPLIVKPNNEGSGMGIKRNSLVNNHHELSTTVTEIINRFHGPALVESYLPGREFTVSLIGNDHNLLVLPIIEINFASFPKDSPPLDTYEAKFVYGATGEIPMHETEFCPAIIDKVLERKIIKLAKAAYTSIGCQDYGRIDIRLDNQGEPHVLEINHPVGLMSDPSESSFFTISARAHGWTFKQTIGAILTTAFKRLNL